MNVSLYVLQRATAALLAPMIVTHVGVIFYATRHGLTAVDILSRTSGNIAWGAFYALFVLAASAHASIGIRNILVEWSPLDDRGAGIASLIFGLGLLGLGLRAVAAVTLP
jgi:succinate dehydrogenase subunit C